MVIQENRVRILDFAHSRREREILEFLYRHGESHARDVQASLDGSPTYSTVRALLTVMDRKGVVRRRLKGVAYLYEPVVPLRVMRDLALRKLVHTYFGGSVQAVIDALQAHDRSHF